MLDIYITQSVNKLIIKKLNKIMSKLDELNAKVDEMQAHVDAMQEAIAAAIQALKDQIANGATPEQLQAVIDRLSVVEGDIDSTQTA